MSIDRYFPWIFTENNDLREAVGAVAVVQNEAPLAVYFHCAMHMLNLCASKTCRVTAVRNCVDNVGQMTSFFNNSPKRESE